MTEHVPTVRRCMILWATVSIVMVSSFAFVQYNAILVNLSSPAIVRGQLSKNGRSARRRPRYWASDALMRRP